VRSARDATATRAGPGTWNDQPVDHGLTDDDYEQLLAFRTELRRFLRSSEQEAADAGVTPAQHQLLLAIRGNSDPAGPTISDAADALLLRHHSAVGLVNRAVAAGLVRRVPDRRDLRVARLALTPSGSRCLTRLAEAHLAELADLAPQMTRLTDIVGRLRDGNRT
jgi:DNA-binding MarR family transcriptional regulator